MKKQIKKLQCLFWFYLGDISSKLHWWEWTSDLYQYSMLKSCEINDKYQLKIWKNS